MSQANESLNTAPGTLIDRRSTGCRRSPTVRSLIRGNARPRRRFSRRVGDHNMLVVDWYPPKMMYLALGILLLSCIDALFTLNLLALGAEEVNFFMRVLIEKSVGLFLGFKIALTGVSVIILVVLAQQRFMGWFRVVRIMQVALVGYSFLIAYELYLLSIIISG
jgi:hypothetical protein